MPTNAGMTRWAVRVRHGEGRLISIAAATGERINAQSHRFRQFGALTAEDMATMTDGEVVGGGWQPVGIPAERRFFRGS